MAFIGGRTSNMAQSLQDKINSPAVQRRLIMGIVCVALLLDNMLYMVIVPIIPMYLRDQGVHPFAPRRDNCSDGDGNWTTNATCAPALPVQEYDPPSQDASIGLLFASKAIVQLLVNPLSGTVIDRKGYDMPMVIGLGIIFLSTTIFAFGQSYTVLFIARSMQGAGSAFADTAGLAMIADSYPEEGERSRALGIALAFISFGSLFAPPFGGILYEFAGKCVPFILLAMVALIDGLLIIFAVKPTRRGQGVRDKNTTLKGTPIYKLILDPYIAVCAGGLVMANVSLAFLEPTIAVWMKATLNSSEWAIGMVWLPAFFPHIIGVFLTVKLLRFYPTHHWLIIIVGLCLEGVSCLILPFCPSYLGIVIPIMIDCFGIALVDTAVLPTLGYLVDVRHVSVYGSVYAIADISYSLAYAFGPIIAGGIVDKIGYVWLNVGIFVSNILYAPVILMLRNVHQYKQFENEDNVLLDDPPHQQYKTYIMNNLTGSTPKEVASSNGVSHLELANTSRTFNQSTDSESDFRSYQ